MKRLMLLLAVSGIVMASVSAQETAKAQKVKQTATFEKVRLSPQERAIKLTAKLDTLVTLSGEQKAKIQSINEVYLTKLQVKKDELKVLRKEQRAEIKAILTPEQGAKLQVKKEDFKQKRSDFERKRHHHKE